MSTSDSPNAGSDRHAAALVRDISHGNKLKDVSFELHLGEVLGLVGARGPGPG